MALVAWKLSGAGSQDRHRAEINYVLEAEPRIGADGQTVVLGPETASD